MKAIPIALSPTRSRALNVFLGLVLALASSSFSSLSLHIIRPILLEYRSGYALPHAVHNWIGLFGAELSDLILQFLGHHGISPASLDGRPRLGLDALALRRVSLASVRGDASGSSCLLPAVFGLLPWHWRWLHAVPVEGVIGRLVAGSLVGLPQYAGGVAGGRGLGRCRRLLCVRGQLLDD